MAKTAKIAWRLKSDAGAALVEYALIIAGVALIGALAVAVFGDRVSSMLSTAADTLPGPRTNTSAPAGSRDNTTEIKLYDTATEQAPASAGQADIAGHVGENGSLSTLVVETKNK